MYKCPHCGGEMEFLPESGIIKCEYCGSEFTPDSEELNRTRKKAEEHTVETDAPETDASDKGKVYVCTQCGASLYTLEDTGVTFCSYCGSQAFLESRMKGKENLMPDVVIPFRISKDKCQEIYKQKIKSAWFLPRVMRKDDTIDKFRGIYMPCWIYSGEAEAEGDYATTKTTRSGRDDIIKTYKVRADAKGVYEGFVEDAAASFPDSIMREISPFDMRKAKPFKDTYMTGFYADIGNVPADVYQQKIEDSLNASIKNDLSKNHDMTKFCVTDSQINRETEVKTKITNVRKGFIPVWFLSNRNQRTGLMSYAVINGLNGKIHADLPVDVKKYLLVSLLIAIPVFLLLQFFVMKPTTLLVITMILLGILMFFGTKMIGDAYIQEHGLNDEGLLYLERGTAGAKGKAADKAAAKASSGTGGKSKAKRSVGKRVLNIFMGLLCFIIMPIVAALLQQILGVDLIVWGFIVGIGLFIFFVTDKTQQKKQSSTGSDGTFAPGGKVKLPFIMVIRSILFPLIGVLAGLIILIANPVHDAYYYGASVLCCIMLIITMLDFTSSNNRLSLRKPAQLGKRGGDEND